MDLTHRFTVPASLPQTWDAFNDVSTLAPCFPGANVTHVEGPDFAGSVRTKIGPLALQYEGVGGYLERNSNARRAVIQTRGRDRRGNGTATTTITATFVDHGAVETEVVLRTDLDLAGRPSRFGRGVVADVVDKVVQQFASTLSAKFAEGDVDPAPAPADLRRRELPAELELAIPTGIAETDGDVQVGDIPATDRALELGAVPEDIDAPTAGRTSIEEELGLDAPTGSGAEVASPARRPALPRPAPSTRAGAPRPYTPPRNSAQPHVHVAGSMASVAIKQYGPYVAIIGVVAALAVRILRSKPEKDTRD